MSYYICDSNVDPDDPTHKKLEIKDTLQDSEAENILDCFSFLGKLTMLSNMRDIVFNNGLELQTFLITDNLRKLVFEDKKEGIVLITEANRLIMNYCVSSRIFLDRTTDFIRKISQSELDILNEFIKTQYDTSFAYRFFYKLRNYIVHDRLPFSFLRTKLPNIVELACLRNNLLEFDKWGSKLLSEIRDLPEIVHIESYVDDYSGRLYAIYLKSVFSFRKEILAAHSIINMLCKKYSIQKPIILVGDMESLELSNLRPFPFEWLWQATEDLKKHPGVHLRTFE